MASDTIWCWDHCDHHKYIPVRNRNQVQVLHSASSGGSLEGFEFGSLRFAWLVGSRKFHCGVQGAHAMKSLVLYIQQTGVSQCVARDHGCTEECRNFESIGVLSGRLEQSLLEEE